ncbi:hypothetical protein [Labilibaculum sp.]|uniref:hypothetical protein n=1 Tax=Labilibaculum sp. TaxID=2060723 RepID=UPI003567468E
MRPKITEKYEKYLEIIEFYRIQPKVDALQIEKIEEYLTLMSAHYQNFCADIEDCIGLPEPVELEIIMDVLNSYLNVVGEEIVKIFPEEVKRFSPINLQFSSCLNEVQAIELYRNFNGLQSDFYGIKDDLDEIEKNVFESSFINEFAVLTKKLISSINSDLIVRVEDLI